MTPRRLRLALVVGGAALGALALLAWTQPWFDLELDAGQHLSVAGQSAAPALSALGLATLALAGALAIAGRRFRVVLGVIELVIGALVVVTSVTALIDPVAASASVISDATAVSGAESLAALVASVSVTAWPYLAVVIGALLALVGVAVVVTSRRWPGPTRRYETGTAETGTAEATRTGEGATGAWDALSEGRDPT